MIVHDLTFIRVVGVYVYVYCIVEYIIPKLSSLYNVICFQKVYL